MCCRRSGRAAAGVVPCRVKYIPRDDQEARSRHGSHAPVWPDAAEARSASTFARLSAERLVDAPVWRPIRPAELAVPQMPSAPTDVVPRLGDAKGLLERQPRHRTGAGRSGTTAANQRPSEAAAYWRRAINQGPRRWHYHFQLASAMADQREWTAALAECEPRASSIPCRPKSGCWKSAA